MRADAITAPSMTRPHTPLPIDDALPALLDAVRTRRQAVLQAPPGAGKTTRVPLALLESGLVEGRILMLEPRRLAARAAAERMAATLGEKVGQTVGYRIRGEVVSGRDTRIEVVTEGILTRMIQSDPGLEGIGAILFDEFHERSVHADLGLALALEIRGALREDLCLVVMSATLDAAPVAALLGDAPMITSEGRAFPVDIRWLDRPWSRPDTRGPRFEDAAAGLVLTALEETVGGVLVFLPGEGEIRRVEGQLKSRVPSGTLLQPLFGAMPFRDQQAAIRPAAQGRKVVLATSIAETSLTIEDIRTVVDCGRARRARFDPGTGMSRLVTERVTRAEAEQRRGRAGRIAEGTCYRMWTKGEEGGLAPFALPEITVTDLAPLVLDCALWGARNPADLPFMTPPDPGRVAEAQRLLHSLGALAIDGAITPHGRALAAMPLHPRLAHMVALSGQGGPDLAALLSERDLVAASGQRPPADLSLRIAALKDPARFEADRPLSVNRAVRARIRDDAKRIRPGSGPVRSPGAMAALAYPDRIGLRRPGEAPRYLLSGGRGAVLADGDPLGSARLIVATDLDGAGTEATIRIAAALSEAKLRDLYGDRIETRETCAWSRRDRAVSARKLEMFGALPLSDRPWPDCPPEMIAAAMAEGLSDLGLSALALSNASRLLIARVEFLRSRGVDLPDFSEPGLLATAGDWLALGLARCRNAADLARLDPHDALAARLDWGQRETLDRLAPAAITAPTGTRLAIDWSGERPSVSVRVQELFGMTTHPTVGPDRVPLQIELLSPARRPIQITADLPGFWASSWADVRKDMRGRYPKHPWPENPADAEATTRVKPCGT
jgi:ATP-dependent helicase HrpB